MKTPQVVIAAAVITCAIAAQLPAETLTVAGNANIFGAGHSTPPAPGGGGAGQLPPSVSFAPGQFSALTLSSVTGTVTLNVGTGDTPNNPDGTGAASADSDIASFGGISGIHALKAGYLVGVFLTNSEPAAPAPPILDFTVIGTGFTTLSPVINQTFFIGDGKTGDGSGTQQQFTVPPTATRLFLGIADAPAYHGSPGAYVDNIGSFTATFNIPEPSCISFLGLGLAGCLLRRTATPDRGLATCS
jgi:hypothetical protein